MFGVDDDIGYLGDAGFEDIKPGMTQEELQNLLVQALSSGYADRSSYVVAIKNALASAVSSRPVSHPTSIRMSAARMAAQQNDLRNAQTPAIFTQVPMQAAQQGSWMPTLMWGGGALMLLGAGGFALWWFWLRHRMAAPKGDK